MKKIGLIVITLVLMVVLVGCKEKNETLTCTKNINDEDMTITNTFKYNFTNNKVSNLKVEMVFKDFDSDNIERLWPAFKSQFENEMPVEVDGFKRSIKSDDQNYILTIFIDIDYSKISKDTMKKYEIEDIKGKSYKEIKKIATENDGMTCN